MSMVWDNFPRGGSDKLTMLALADWCNDQGGSLRPSVSSVAKKINLTDKQARVIMHRLIEEGWLSVIGNHNGGNPGQSRHYVLNVKKLLTPPVEVIPTPPAEVTPNLEVTPPVEVRDPSRGGSFTPPVDGSLSTSEPSRTTNKKPCALATRLPADWTPSEEDVLFCKTKRPDLDPAATAEHFRDYWIAVAGSKGKKLDWPATWRNWVRNQKQEHKARSVHDERKEWLDKALGKRKERDITAHATRLD